MSGLAHISLEEGKGNDLCCPLVELSFLVLELLSIELSVLSQFVQWDCILLLLLTIMRVGGPFLKGKHLSVNRLLHGFKFAHSTTLV